MLCGANAFEISEANSAAIPVTSETRVLLVNWTATLYRVSQDHACLPFLP